MPYVTVMATPKKMQITLEDILYERYNSAKFKSYCHAGTVTKYVQDVEHSFFEYKPRIYEMITHLINFNDTYNSLLCEDMSQHYRSFKIPKRSGGFRQIDAPDNDLMEALRNLKLLFEDTIGVLYHTSAFAYIKNRSTIDAVKRHQLNNSHWFYKADCSNFFGSITKDFVMKQFEEIFPLSEIMKTFGGKAELSKALDLCFLNGGLPQGTPISPLLTNVIMIPIDHELCNSLINFGNSGQKIIYTRYADDLLLSSRQQMDPEIMTEFIKKTFKTWSCPFELNPSKTRYGSRSGKNWNLGVMLNKDNEITIGYRRKKELKVIIFNFCADRAKGIKWGAEDLQTLNGKISYYHMVEKNTVDEILDNYSKKFNIDVLQAIRNDMSNKII